MTTIAWDGITIAGDGRSTAGGWIMDDGNSKLFRRNGEIIGVAGTWCSVPVMVDYIAGGEWEKDAEEVTAIVINGACGRVYEGAKRSFRVKPPYAIGSGCAAAMAAMMAGADAYQAIKITARLDPETGGRIKRIRCVE